MSSMNISIRMLMLMSQPSSQAHKLLIPSQVRTRFSVLMISAVIFFLPSFLHLFCLCLFTGTGGPWYLAVLPHHSKKPGKLIFVNLLHYPQLFWSADSVTQHSLAVQLIRRHFLTRHAFLRVLGEKCDKELKELLRKKATANSMNLWSW